MSLDIYKSIDYQDDFGQNYTGAEDIPKAQLEAARFMGQKRKSFRKMLEKYVPRVSYSVPTNARILDLGCGECDEALVLSGYFGNQPDCFDSEEVLVVGIDIDEKSIERARIEYQTPDAKVRYAWTET